MSRPWRGALAVVAALGIVSLAWALWPAADGRSSRTRVRATVAVREALDAGGLAGFARARAPRALSFPDDHGPHPAFRTEWWYYTGNLATATGRHVGFQLTFFRTALAPPDHVAAGRGSAWAASQVYLAHFALTDTAGGRFHATSRLSREALGLAGARAQPFHVWVEDWSARSETAGEFPVRLAAADGPVAIDLLLERGKPVVLQGDRGLSAKGPEPGNASYYYSFTRMPATGTVRIGDEVLAVSGLAWMDREWSTSALGRDLAGWDWFALQLDDGRDLMVFRLRRRDGSPDPQSAGTLVAANGDTRPLAAGAATLEPVGHWTSPASGVRYPSGWRLGVPAEDLSIEITPRLRDQELLVGPRYWEGAVRVQGSAAGRPITGQGYVELVGYGE